MATQKNRQEIIDALSKCGILSYQDMVNLLYSIAFLNELDSGSFDGFISRFTGSWTSSNAQKGKYDVDYYVVYNSVIYRSTENNNVSIPGSSGTWTPISSQGADLTQFDPTPVANGDTLPVSTTPKWLFLGAGTYVKPEGGSLTTTGQFNIVATNGSTYRTLLQTSVNLSAYLLKSDYNILGPYATITDANNAITDTIVNGKNQRDSKLVLVGTTGNYKIYWWKGGTANANLVPFLGTIPEDIETIKQITSNIVLDGGSVSTGKREPIYYTSIYGWGALLPRNGMTVARKVSVFAGNSTQTKGDDNFVFTLYGSNSATSIGTALATKNVPFEDISTKKLGDRIEVDFGSDFNVSTYAYVGLFISYNKQFVIQQTYVAGSNIVAGFYAPTIGTIAQILSNEYSLAFEVFGKDRIPMLYIDPKQIAGPISRIASLEASVANILNTYVPGTIVNNYMKTGVPTYVYSDGTIFGWGGQALNTQKKIGVVWIQRDTHRNKLLGANIVISLYGSNSTATLGTLISTKSISAADYLALADGAEMQVVFDSVVDVSAYTYVGVFAMYDTFVSFKQTRSGLSKGFYSVSGATPIAAGLDAGNIYGLYFEASETTTREKGTAVKEFQLPSSVLSAINQSITGDTLSQSRTLTKSAREYPFKTDLMKADKDIYLLLHSDSIGAWQSSLQLALEGPASAPPVCDRTGLANRIFHALKFGAPVYKRFDYGKKTLVNFWDPRWADDTQAAFTEVGVFKTFYYGGQGRPANQYTVPQFTSEIDASVCPITSFHETDTQRNIPKRISSDANASITFVIPAGYEKFDFIFHEHNLGDICSVSISGGAGKVKCHTKQNDWVNSVEANGYSLDTIRHTIASGKNDSIGVLQKRLYFKKTDISQAITITITKSANTAKYLMYWGVSYWGTINLPYAMHIIASGRGGYAIENLIPLLDSDIRLLNPDAVISECTLINNLGTTGDDNNRTKLTAYRNNWNTFDAYLSGLSIPVGYLIPHTTTTMISGNPDSAVNFYNGVKGHLLSNNKAVLDARSLMYNLWNTYYRKQMTFTAFVASLMYDGTTHPNQQGFDVYQALVETIAV